LRKRERGIFLLVEAAELADVSVESNFPSLAHGHQSEPQNLSLKSHAATSAPQTQADPIFAAIEAHRAASTELEINTSQLDTANTPDADTELARLSHRMRSLPAGFIPPG
jgi:hypothetical protein